MRQASVWICVGVFIASSALVSACFVDPTDDGFVPDCSLDSECPASDDPCKKPACFGGFCSEQNNVGTDACECASDSDCYGPTDTACSKTTCDLTAHACVAHLEPAGPAEGQTPNDCVQVMCDGAHATPIEMPDDTDAPSQEAGDCVTLTCSAGEIQVQKDPMDLPADKDCAKGYCNGTLVAYENDPDGTACAATGVCFLGGCVTGCTPTNASACGDEGPSEPSNDTSASPASFTKNTCGFLDTSDVDWFTFYAKDRDFRTNILHFQAWSTAPTIEMCAFVKCSDGTTAGGGGCATYLPGPNGSQGCCWTGASDGFSQAWDLDCGTVEDSGDVYVSVRSTTADTCETYAVSMTY